MVWAIPLPYFTLIFVTVGVNVWRDSHHCALLFFISKFFILLSWMIMVLCEAIVSIVLWFVNVIPIKQIRWQSKTN